MKLCVDCKYCILGLNGAMYARCTKQLTEVNPIDGSPWVGPESWREWCFMQRDTDGRYNQCGLTGVFWEAK